MSKISDEKTGFDLGLGGIFKGLGGFIELLGELSEKGEELRREGEIKIGKETKGVYGFTIRTGITGEPTISSFGNIKKTPKGPKVAEEREPIVDVFDEKQEVRIIAEVPGVQKDSIRTEIKGDVLTLEAKDADPSTSLGTGRQYYKEVVLPKNIKPGTLTRKYKNGVLEVRIAKK